MLPQALASIQTLVAPSARPRAIAVFAAWTGVGNVLGQGVGGLVISALPNGFGWRGAMATVTLIALTTWLGGVRLRENHGATSDRFDVAGGVLAGGSLLLIIAGLALGPAYEWSGTIIGCLILGATLLGLLFAHQRRGERRGLPVVLPPSVLSLSPVRTGMAIAAGMFAGFAGLLYMFSFTTQQALELSALGSGLAILGLMTGFIGASTASGRLVVRWGGVRVMTIGGVAQAMGWLLTGIVVIVQPPHLVWWIQLPLFVLGTSYGLLYAPLIGAVMTAVPTQVAGLTGGLVSTSQQAGYGLGVAALGAVFTGMASHTGMVAAFGYVAIGLTALGLALTLLVTRLKQQAH